MTIFSSWRRCRFGLAAVVFVSFAGAVSAEELSLSYFMGPKHPMNKAVFTPFGEKLAEVSNGALTVKQFAGGALNSAPPKQYSILVNGVADIAFALPGYTADLFPVTNTVTVPGVCDDAESCTEALWRVKDEIDKEFDAKILALWGNNAPILITRDKRVTKMSDLKGMKIRVTSQQDAPFVEALGASAVSQPVSVINRNLANGTIDAIAIGASGIRSFKLHEPGKYLITGFPGSGSAFVLLMNNDVYNRMSAREKAWIDQASARQISERGGTTYRRAAEGGIKLFKDSGREVLAFSDREQRRMWRAMKAPLETFRKRELQPGVTGAEIMDRMSRK